MKGFVNYYLQYLIIRLAAFLLQIFPVSFSDWCGKRAGDLIFFCIPRRRKIAFENIHKAFGDSLSEPDKRDIARSSFQSMTVSMIELFQIQKMKLRAEECFAISGKEHLDHAFAQGKGITLVISHLGSWEYLSFLPHLTGKDWAVVVKDIRNPYLNDYIKRLRLLTTVIPIAKINSMRPILKALKNNHGIAILIDQWSGAEGLWVDFFDVKTSTTSIPARLAKQTGCALIPAYCLRKSFGKYDIHIHAPVLLDPEDKNWEQNLTEKLNGLLEEQIKKYPKQWLWGHRRWKKKPLFVRETAKI